jgi:hypothetical protein
MVKSGDSEGKEVMQEKNVTIPAVKPCRHPPEEIWEGHSHTSAWLSWNKGLCTMTPLQSPVKSYPPQRPDSQGLPGLPTSR